MKRGILILAIFAALALAGYLSAQATTEVFTATATAKDATRSASEPVKIVINVYLTDTERAAAIDAFKKSGAAGLETLKDLGTIEVKGVTLPIKYASSRSMGPGAGRMVTVVTAKPILFIGGNAPGAKTKAGYDVGLALLILDSSDKGDGEINPAVKLKVDDQGALVTEDYGAVKVWLKNVVKAK